MKHSTEKRRLCWTRRDLVEATGLSQRSIRNLEQRGLLVRVPVGLNVACYSDASVRALFAETTAPGKAPAFSRKWQGVHSHRTGTDNTSHQTL